MPKPKNITAETVSAILLKDGDRPIGVIIRNGHRVFYEVTEMNDEAIIGLFEKA